MKLFGKNSNSEEAQKELEAIQLYNQLEQERLELERERLELEKQRLELEKTRQESFNKKLDDLILVGKAVYTIFKQEQENIQAACDRQEGQIRQATKELIDTQEKVAKVMIAHGREENQKVVDIVHEEVAKVTKIAEDAKEELLSAAKELNDSVIDNTSTLGGKLDKLDALEASIKDINVSVVTAPVESEIPAYTPEITVDVDADIMLEEEMPIPEPDMFAVMDEEDEIPEDVLAFAEDVLKEDKEEEILVDEDILFALESEEAEEESELMIPDIEEEDELIIPEPELVMSEPEPVVEEPVMDDPNRAMTPEEIAALIASMS